MNPPDPLKEFLPLDGGKYARFGSGSRWELIFGTCEREERPIIQFSITGSGTLLDLADKISELCFLGVDSVLNVKPRLLVRYSCGTDSRMDALDIIETGSPRQDRTFSIIGRSYIKELASFLRANLERA